MKIRSPAWANAKLIEAPTMKREITALEGFANSRAVTRSESIPRYL